LCLQEFPNHIALTVTAEVVHEPIVIGTLSPGEEFEDILGHDFVKTADVIEGD
jgi:hypothetical protein